MTMRGLARMIAIGGGVIVLTAVVCLLPLLSVAEGQPAPISPLGVRVVGPKEWLVGSSGALRVVVTDHAQDQPARRARVRISLEAQEGGATTRLYEGRTDAHGTLQAGFDVPELPPGTYALTVAASWRGQTDEVTQPVTLKRSVQVLLTTDKPIYQPSQVIHLRALALKRPGLKAVQSEEVTLEVSDAKGNKVFKQTGKTNDFGIVSADFQLADQVNMGAYKLRALVGEDTAEKTVTVKQYVLPKFKVAVSTDRGYYLPGDKVEGKVQADYFFGKPVSESAVAISVKTFDVEFTEIQRISGETDAEGTFTFDCRLPDHFVGQPLEQGQAFLQFDVEVTDKAEHAEKAVHTSTVAAGALVINAVPETGKLVGGVENVIYIMTSLPTGEPSPAALRVGNLRIGDSEFKLSRSDFRTDELGIAEVPVALPLDMALPGERNAPPWRRGSGPAVPSASMDISARLPNGTVVDKTVELSILTENAEGLLLRLSQPIATVGERIEATAYTSAASGTVYFDMVKDRQTMLTRAADIRDGKATVDLQMTPEVGGTVYVSAYRIMPGGQIVRSTRPMFVRPAADLTIDIEADQETYLPGGEAKLAFSVADAAGRPVAAALGVNVVDESVFALQELQPGMEKVFFYLEQELMKPRYEIHGFEFPSLITGVEPVRREEQSDATRAARVLLASVEVPDLSTFEQDTYMARVREARTKWAEEMRTQVERIARAIGQHREETGEYPAQDGGVEALLASGAITRGQLKDLWENDLVLKPGGWDDERMQWVVVISAGPDGKIGTADDVIMSSMYPGRVFDSEQETSASQLLEEQMVFRAGVPLAPGAPGVLKADAAGPAMDAVAESPAGEGKPQVRIREYFPETMFFEPSLITDERGKATLTLPMADSITTWRLAALANSAVGQLGSTTRGLRCFQDFFVDIDLPVSLTQNDQVSIPVAVYNYLPDTQEVRLELTKDDWFELDGDPVQTLRIAGNEVDVRYFTLKVKKIGDHPLTVHAYGSKMNDAIKRSIEVVPDGKLEETTANGRLKGQVEETITLPAGAIEDANRLMVKIYPGVFSQVVEGLDSILRMPFGCFEQTSSVTWPNVLVVDYMKTTGQGTPETRMKAEGFINTGYQRMLAYEVPGGGFSWFGDAPANKLLTAYGLMEFHDMSAVHNVDPDIITRTQQWLLSQADADGVYKRDENYYHAETWTKIQVEDLLPTAYVVWGLTHTGCKDARIEASVNYIRKNWQKAKEPYTLAIVANALVGADAVLHEGEADDTTLQVLEALVGMAKTDAESMWWASEISGVTNSTGKSADLEATGMAVLALMRSGLYGEEVTAVLNYLVSTKDPNGTWYSTNATILALRALTMAQKGATGRTDGEVTITVNGQRVTGFALTPKDADVVRFVDCTQAAKVGKNEVELSFAGEGSALYQVVGSCYMPWKAIDRPLREPLTIEVEYDKTSLAKDDTVTANVTVKNNTPATTSMIVVDLGIPPGFTVDGGEFAELVGSKKIDRYSLTGRQVIIYLEKMTPNQEIRFSYPLKARFPLKAKTPQSTVYEYYNPDNRAEAEPVDIEVTEG